MALFTLGLSHHTAPLRLRERVTIGPEQSAEALRNLASTPGVEQAAILSTCNRTEVYMASADDGERLAREWLHRWHRLGGTELDPHLYGYRDAGAVHHMLRVATGLDSLVLGEPQVLGQLKQAYQDARSARTLGRELERWFQHSFATAKRVRSRTALGDNPVSVAYAAVRLARQIFDDLGTRRVLVVGAGETAELTLKHLESQGVSRIAIANRRPARARELAEEHGARAVPLADLDRYLPDTDIIITCTAARLPIISARALENARKKRKRRPVFIVDLGVPRDVDPGAAGLKDTFLFTVDDLEQAIEQNRAGRRDAAAEAENLIEFELDRFMHWLNTQRAVPAIRRYRDLADEQRAAALGRARKHLARGEPPDAVLTRLARDLTRQLTHLPSVRLRNAAVTDENLLRAAEQLLGLEYEDENENDDDR